MSDIHATLAQSHPSLTRGQVWCKTCRRTETVDSAKCLRSGWPECCGHTMTIDHPAALRSSKEGDDAART